MNKEVKLKNFNPNSAADKNSNIFGLPFTTKDAEIILIPVPWDATVSYLGGTSRAPKRILAASKQVDLFVPEIADAWKFGVAMADIPQLWVRLNNTTEKQTAKSINALCEKLKNWIKNESLKYLDKSKTVGIVGGEHSVPLGLMEALSEKYDVFGILQIDAHCDLRNGYEGLQYSHASIMYNAMKLAQIKKLVQVGIRDYCEKESDFVKKSGGRIKLFSDSEMKSRMFHGEKWGNIADEIIQTLPENVYISFDVDGLEPSCCPNTGTPVPGGLSFAEAMYLLESIVRNGKKIIGFDVCETGDGEWDANVAARILFKIVNLAGASCGKLHLTR